MNKKLSEYDKIALEGAILVYFGSTDKGKYTEKNTLETVWNAMNPVLIDEFGIETDIKEFYEALYRLDFNLTCDESIKNINQFNDIEKIKSLIFVDVDNKDIIYLNKLLK